MDNRLFRDAMGKFATGITVVTTDYHNETHGMTVNAFMSVSLEPKLIAISIDEKASMFEILKHNDSFGVSMLTEDQKDLSMIFAKQIENKKQIQFQQLDGVPILKDALTAISCKIRNRITAGDHMVIIAEVTDLEVNHGDPILYFGGNYRNIAKE
ncbi:flavin reductase family protein [Aquibacillus albus]|uniref:Flavin reductase (DIM6/NTAB) family NADH-FMN oxidoreductase RutF n=1 Tax=Aquibacillus albus TaxID=1168171 RepID=A0ABS2N1Z6_9BACI|nr:flavin reductase family protein [Aquibacillus albus]MBM7572147.1 flavin reductase (DIM6/NTAB) family NADH-FMN oxidoreductase RutF [Aquibacillus albus]